MRTLWPRWWKSEQDEFSVRRLGAAKRTRLDVAARAVWGLAGLLFIALPVLHSFNITPLGQSPEEPLFLAALAHLFLTPCWVLWRFAGVSRRLSVPDLRREMALTGIGAGEFLRGQLRRDWVAALVPPLLPALGAAAYLVLSVLTRLTTGFWTFPEMVTGYSIALLAVTANGAISAGGAAWLAVARCRGASLPGIVFRSAVVVLVALLALPVLTLLFWRAGSPTSHILPLMAALGAFFLAAAQFNQVKGLSAGTSAAGPGLPGLALRHLAAGLLAVILAIPAWSSILFTEGRPLGGWIRPYPESTQPLTDWILQSVPLGSALLAFAVAVILSPLVRRRFMGTWTSRSSVQHLAVGCLAGAGGTWLLQLNPTSIHWRGSTAQNILQDAWPVLCVVLPAIGTALLAARRTDATGQERLAVAGRQFAASFLGIGLGLAVQTMRDVSVGEHRRITWGSLIGPMTLLSILGLFFVMAFSARRAAIRKGDQPPAIAALLFGMAVLVGADGLRWVPNINLYFDSILPAGAWMTILSLGFAYRCFRRLERVYFDRL